MTACPRVLQEKERRRGGWGNTHNKAIVVHLREGRAKFSISGHALALWVHEVVASLVRVRHDRHRGLESAQASDEFEGISHTCDSTRVFASETRRRDGERARSSMGRGASPRIRPQLVKYLRPEKTMVGQCMGRSSRVRKVECVGAPR